MNTTNIQALAARRRFGELLELVHYQHQQFRIKRQNKTMARLVDESFMLAIEELIESDSAIADTLALMLNDEAQTDIKQSLKEYRQGKTRPVKELFDEIRNSRS